METKQVTMTAEEQQQFEAFKAQQAKEAAAKRRKENREAYATLVDEEIEAALPELRELSAQIKTVKTTVYGNFAEVLKMKAEVMGPFNKLYALERYCARHDIARDEVVFFGDDYREGGNDQQGNIKASRVLQLRRMAEETGNERFIEGVKIIEESYQPATTKQYIRAEYKDEKGVWRNVPLSVTDVE